MAITTLLGTIENGHVRLPANVRLPENTLVYVVVPDNPSGKKFDLAEVIARMPPDYHAGDENFGEPVGKEEW